MLHVVDVHVQLVEMRPSPGKNLVRLSRGIVDAAVRSRERLRGDGLARAGRGGCASDLSSELRTGPFSNFRPHKAAVYSLDVISSRLLYGWPAAIAACSPMHPGPESVVVLTLLLNLLTGILE